MSVKTVGTWLIEDDAFEFLQYLVDVRGLAASDLLYLLEKPWKWRDEYEGWKVDEARRNRQRKR